MAGSPRKVTRFRVRDGGPAGMLYGVSTPCGRTRRLVVLALAGALAGSLPVAGAAAHERSGVDGYPQRIGYQRSPAPLPDRPGPLAATFYDNDFGNGFDVGVTSHGHLWKLPSGPNLLSPDGTLLLERQAKEHHARLMVHHLSDGTRRVFGNIFYADASHDRTARYTLSDRAPVRWAPEGSSVLASVGEHPHPSRLRPMVLDLASGALTAVGAGVPAGFRSATESVTVRKLGGARAPGGIVATTTDLGTGASKDVPLRLDHPWRGRPDAPLAASVSPDGATLLLVEVPRGAFPHATLRLFSLADGREQPTRHLSPLDRDDCPAGWLGDDPVLPTKAQGSPAGSVLVTADSARPLVAVHPRLQSFCVQWAGDALAAGPRWTLFGTWPYLWTWYWWELLLAAGVPVVGLVLLWRGRRRARRAAAATAARR